mmetsp:Transcript_8825/g.8170  ORF Transcript_8825/g.8170 Transcript_8825/m.8170 type:complete len:308 (-) Transcript_8825:6476-7399(-)
MITHQSSFQRNVLVTAFHPLMFNFGDRLNEFDVGFFRHVNLELRLDGFLAFDDFRGGFGIFGAFLGSKGSSLSLLFPLPLFFFPLLHDLFVLGGSDHPHGLHGVIPVSVLVAILHVWSLVDADGLAEQVDLVVLDGLGGFEDHLDLLGGLRSQMAHTGVELELVLVALVPPEPHRLVLVVRQHERRLLGLVDDAVPYYQLVLHVLRQPLEDHVVCVPLPNYHHLVLLIRIRFRVKGKEALLNAGDLGDELDVEALVGLGSDDAVERAQELEALVLDHIKEDRGRDRAFILEKNIHHSFLVETSLFEL